MNYLQKLYKTLKFVYQSIIIVRKESASSLESPITFAETFKFNSVSFFILGCNLLIF